MKIKIISFLSIVLLFKIPVFSQEKVVSLTLEEAIMIAKEQSADALIARHRFRMNYWQFRSFKADYLPSVNLDASLPSFNRSYGSVRQNDGTYKFQYNTYADYYGALSINQKVGLTGGSVYLRSDLTRHDEFFDDSTQSEYWSTPVVVGYKQPIFKYNNYRWARQLEPLKYEKAKRQYLEDVEQVAMTTTSHFFNLLLAQIEKGISEKNLHNYDTLYRIAQGRYQLGKIAENDLLQLELNYLRAKASVDNASLNYENMLFRLKSYLRIKEDGDIRLTPPEQTWHGTISASTALAEARKNTALSIEFQERMINAESELRYAKMNGRFDADLSLEYGLNQSAQEIPDAYKSPLERQKVNLALSVPILDWGRARGEIKLKESNYELEQTSVEQEVIDFEQNVFLNVMEFNMQKDQLFIAAKADTVAQKRYDVTQKRYMIGQVNDILDLNYAQIDNDNAKKGYFSALRNYWINYFQLRKMTLYDFRENKLLIFDIRDTM
ncbi:MAG: TolC family protein [Bacteroidales bacterium]|nr:TolC family protein [Bacteroidales bacterium]